LGQPLCSVGTTATAELSSRASHPQAVRVPLELAVRIQRRLGFSTSLSTVRQHVAVEENPNAQSAAASQDALEPTRPNPPARKFGSHPLWHTSQWPMLAITSGVVLLGLTIAAACTWVLGILVFGSLPDGTPGPPTGDEGWLAPIKVALTIAAGVGGAVALVVAYRKQRLSERDEPRQIAAEQRAHASAEREIGRVYLDQYAVAVQQLGDGNPTVQLAGVYALANLADAWPNRRQQCLDVLCGHLRLPWESSPPDPLASVQVQHGLPEGGSQTLIYPDPRGEREVRETILRVIGAHLRRDDRRAPGEESWSSLTLDLTGADLPSVDWAGCIIPADAHFGRAKFSGDATFRDAKFGGHASFEEAVFCGEALYDNATFSGGAWFDKAEFRDDAWFREVTFRGRAWFGGATFSGQAWFVKAKFKDDAWFSRTVIRRIVRSDVGATFNASARFTEATFRAVACFDGAEFREVAWFEGARFRQDAQFDATFHKAPRFNGANFKEGVPSNVASFLSDGSDQ